MGRHLAGFLADRGAAHIVLASRRGELTEETGELRARLAARGVALTVAACDVTDRAQVDALLAGADSPGHPLRFVAHLAGVTGMAPYTALSAEEAVHVTAAKVLGATHLHEALGARPSTASCCTAASPVCGAARGRPCTAPPTPHSTPSPGTAARAASPPPSCTGAAGRAAAW
ncbi:ketoreductase domain-containing protein [Actinomadura keratinilytica]